MLSGCTLLVRVKSAGIILKRQKWHFRSGLLLKYRGSEALEEFRALRVKVRRKRPCTAGLFEYKGLY
jgi:hypothetical protein